MARTKSKKDSTPAQARPAPPDAGGEPGHAAGTLPPPPSRRLASVSKDPPRKNVLLLTCMDQRLLDDTVRFMNSLNLQNRYDQVALAGGAMGVNRLSSPSDGGASVWRPVFLHHLSAAIDVLHRPIQDVFLIDHLDCGAYKYLLPEDLAREYREATLDHMREMHAVELRNLAWLVSDFCDEQRRAAEGRRADVLRSCAEDTACRESALELHDERVKTWAEVRVSCFVMDMVGGVTQVE